MNNKDTLIWLNNLRGVTNKSISKLEKYYDNIGDVWLSSDEEILSITGISDKVKQQIINYKDKSYFESIMENIEKKNVEVVTILDEKFPEKLKYIYDCPKVLYTKGDLLKEEEKTIAIVGARKATLYGKWVTEKLSSELLDLGITLVSGMASGVDTEAHISAIRKDKRNIAILGCGVDVVYPKANRNIYEKIIENGCVISEFPLGTEPLRYNFPQRNRIISGLSLGVVVIEASEKSGSLITAHHAIEQGKEVFAVPGNINSIYSKGTNKLIKDGAKMVLDVEDIIEEIRELKNIKILSSKDKFKYNFLSNDERKIISYIEEDPMHIELICHKVNMDVSSVSSILTILEMKGIVKRLPNQLFAII
ncbi:DNA protecting protein, SMF familiy [Gottschalkia acidurici 9a]|uniref:DNA protecting protein, SMF familiy n=1 Tax=Gottschalkia acidurici (strain ATCC 7906 / DSM 604 / BCRC 14475 / CIP 104303 / KCTC 5404 / NCIMB 10678 / 9a) TaxID=1128398 RepID=K0AZC5_GOTA9|nr:DNA-processing protein DprA [Gottschalkia acidurici]AFS78619.1 DNA protecting protein, SMF familiy [Gottschalkia acidurici 9a]